MTDEGSGETNESMSVLTDVDNSGHCQDVCNISNSTCIQILNQIESLTLQRGPLSTNPSSRCWAEHSH